MHGSGTLISAPKQSDNGPRASESFDFGAFCCSMRRPPGAATRVLIKGARAVDPAVGLDDVVDVLLADGVVSQVSKTPLSAAADRVIDAAGLLLIPGLIDCHVHLREPGQEHKETIATGTRAAAAGGFAAVCCMPNTEPALDSVEVLDWLRARVDETAVVPVYPIAAITRGRVGHETVAFDALAAAGAVAFSDDGVSTQDSRLMREALRASARLGLPIMAHCEDPFLVRGSMHEGDVSRRLGVEGIPAVAEEIMIARDCLLARETGGWLHVCHVTTGVGIAAIGWARSLGARVTAEVMPHHLVMSDDWVAGSRMLHNTDTRPGPATEPLHPDTKVNPPLRPSADTVALLAALKAGEFDILATDHAPHAAGEKVETDFASAAFGMSGLELAIPTLLALVSAGHLTVNEVVYRLSTRPAELFNLPVGRLAPGGRANLTLIDPTASWTVDAETLATKSKNTPFLGMTMTGRALLTMVAGEAVHDRC